MRFDYHPDLVEQAVFLTARHDAKQECELHTAIDRLYEIPDQELRLRAFNEAYGELFGRWKLDGILRDTVRRFPPVDQGVDKCVVIPAAGAKAQAVDLFVKKSDTQDAEPARTLLIQLNPEAFLQIDRTTGWLRRELSHVVDMLDDEFGYSPDDIGGSSLERNLQRDRYQVLWRIYVVGRLIRSGQADETELPSLKDAFCRAFACYGVKPSDRVFVRVLNERKLTHHQLVTWASDPNSLLHAAAELLGDGGGACATLCQAGAITVYPRGGANSAGVV